MSLHYFPGRRGVSDIRMRRRRHESPRGEPTSRRRLLVSASFTTAMFLSPVATKSSGGVAALRVVTTTALRCRPLAAVYELTTTTSSGTAPSMSATPYRHAEGCIGSCS